VTLGYMVLVALPTKMAPDVRQVRVVVVPLFVGSCCHDNAYYVCVHCVQVLLPLIDEQAWHWLLLQANLRQRCFFVYHSCPAAWGRDKEERKLLIDHAVKFLLLSLITRNSPFTHALLSHVFLCFIPDRGCACVTPNRHVR